MVSTQYLLIIFSSALLVRSAELLVASDAGKPLQNQVVEPMLTYIMEYIWIPPLERSQEIRSNGP